jgi:hypothetical protein
MKNYISINGKQTELTNEQLKQLGIEINTKPKWDDFGKVKGYYVNIHSEIKYRCLDSMIHSRNLFPTKEEAEACLALSQLCQWRDKYNEGWKPNWCDDTEYKWVIIFKNSVITESLNINMSDVLHFKTCKIRGKFLKDFRELIEIAKPLL